MGLDDKISNKADELAGRGKEAFGAATDDDSLKAEGEADQKKAGLKDKLDSAKDKVEEKIDKVL